MNITLRGVRGSIPTFNPGTKHYGGNTSCIEVREDGWLLVLDAGSGIANVEIGDHLRHRRVDVLLTHLHIDHIQGLGFFMPLFDAGMEVHIWGPLTHSLSLRARLSQYFSPPLTPVYLRELPCQLSIHEVGNSDFTIGPFSIRSAYVIHPGPTVGFRVSSATGILTYLPDHEPELGVQTLPRDKNWLSGSDLAEDADVLIHDAQYTGEEYRNKQGWGHSAMEDVLAFASINKVKRLLLTHHDPTHSDARLDEMRADLAKTHPGCHVPFDLAVEGQRITLPDR